MHMQSRDEFSMDRVLRTTAHRAAYRQSPLTYHRAMRQLNKYPTTIGPLSPAPLPNNETSTSTAENGRAIKKISGVTGAVGV